MAHEHDHMKRPGVGYARSFAIGIGLNVVFVAVEVIYGFIANSSGERSMGTFRSNVTRRRDSRA